MNKPSLLLDTHVLLWLDCDDKKLGPESRNTISAAWREGCVAVSAISFWEAAMLQARKRIALPISVSLWRSDWLAAGLQELPLNGDIALAAVELIEFHADQADRFITATAQRNQAQLITADSAILNWPGSLHRLDARQ